MSCIDVMRRLTDYLQGNLADREATTLYRHVARCEDCRLVVRSARDTLDTYFTVNQDHAANHDRQGLSKHAA